MQKPENWQELSWQEKREWRFKKWRAAEGVKFESAEAKQKHDARVDRLVKAFKVEKPDRVPVNGSLGSFSVYYAGYTLKECMFDPVKMKDAALRYARDFDPDIPGGGAAPNGRQYELMQPVTYKWPGGGLPDEATMFQFVEAEYMKPDEYKWYLRNPADYLLRAFLPRTYGVFAPLAGLGPLDGFRAVGPELMRAAGRPEFKQMAETLLKAHENAVAWDKVNMEIDKAMRAMGYPGPGTSLALAPFDTIADLLRGTHGSVLDMFRQPEKLHEMMENILPVSVASAIEAAEMGDCPLVHIPMHKGDDMFMSDKQFETFYWPTYRRMLLAFIEEGLVPFAVVEGTYNRRLEYIKDMPKTGMFWLFEKSDMALVQKVLGGHTCIAGNVSGSLLRTGTPEDVKKYCRWLIETCAGDGGYILSSGAGIDRCDPANVRALFDSAKEYGTY